MDFHSQADSGLCIHRLHTACSMSGKGLNNRLKLLGIETAELFYICIIVAVFIKKARVSCSDLEQV